MSQRRNSLVTVLAALIIAGTTGAAFATAGTAAADVSIHSSPSGRSGVVDTLYAGETVDIHACSGAWCYITHPGPDGWVPASVLEHATDYSYADPAPEVGGGVVVVIDPGHPKKGLGPIIDPVPGGGYKFPVVQGYPVGGGKEFPVGYPVGGTNPTGLIPPVVGYPVGGKTGSIGGICQVNPNMCAGGKPSKFGF